METCKQCWSEPDKCPCAALEEFFKENRHLMSKLRLNGEVRYPETNSQEAYAGLT